MFARLGVVLLPLLLLGAWLVQRSRRQQPGLEPEPSRRSAQQVGFRTAVGWRWAGLVLGVVGAVQMADLGPLGLGLMLAPTVVGFCVIGGVVIGELVTIPRHDGVRTAALETRKIGSYLPRRLGRLVAASAVGLGALLITTTLMGSVDDMGRAGRMLARRCIRSAESGEAVRATEGVRL